MADRVLAMMNGQTSVRSAWDALFLSGAELLMRQPGIVSLHSLTSLNALHYAFQTVNDERTRKLLLLQAAAFVPLFREAMATRNPKMTDDKIDQQLIERPDDPVVPKLDDVFATLSKDKRAASQGAFLFLKSYPDAVARSDRPRPPADLPERHRFARLQIQRRGDGGLFASLARRAGSVPRGERLLAERFGRPDAPLASELARNVA